MWEAAACAAAGAIFSAASSGDARRQQTAPDQGWRRGTCAGCGAPWAVHDLMNARSVAVATCSYCKRPRFAKDAP